MATATTDPATTDPATTDQEANDQAEQVPLVLALTTEASAEKAERLARALLDRNLVACVSLQPSGALYRWRGEIAQAQEVQLLLKTDTDHLEELHRAVLELHSYDMPEWIWWPASSSGAYAHWLLESLMPGSLKPDGVPPTPAENPEAEDPAG